MSPELLVREIARDAAIDFRKCASRHITARGFLSGYWHVAVDQHPEIRPFKAYFLRLAEQQGGQR